MTTQSIIRNPIHIADRLFIAHVLSLLPRSAWPNCAEVRAAVSLLHVEDPTGTPIDIATALDASAHYCQRHGQIYWQPIEDRQPAETNPAPPTAHVDDQQAVSVADLSMAQGGGTYKQPTPKRHETRPPIIKMSY